MTSDCINIFKKTTRQSIGITTGMQYICIPQTVEKVGQPQASYKFYHINFKEFLIQNQTAIKSDIGLYQLSIPEI